MALAGITCVGEFHYLHHGPGGTPYADPNAMGAALIAGRRGGRAADHAARHLLPGRRLAPRRPPLAGAQLRFGDGDAGGLGGAGGRLAPTRAGARRHARVGAAIHSVRAVPAEPDARRHGLGARARRAAARAPVRAAGRERGHAWPRTAAPRPRCCTRRARSARAAPWSTPPTCTRERHRAARRRPQTSCCLCPTTEADLADGIGPARALRRRGLPAQPGQRQPRGDRPVRGGARAGADAAAGHPAARPLHRRRAARAATVAGHACLGWPDAGGSCPARWPTWSPSAWTRVRDRPARRRRTVLDARCSRPPPRTSGTWSIGGRDVVRDGRHLLVDDVPARAGRRAVRAGDPGMRPRDALIADIAGAGHERHRRADHQPRRRRPDPARAGDARRRQRRGAGHRRRPGRVDRARRPGARRRRRRRRAAGGPCCPGFVDSHAHLVFAGDRGAEFAARMAGQPYTAGGIRSTVAATRAATDARARRQPAPPGRRDARARARRRSSASPATG